MLSFVINERCRCSHLGEDFASQYHKENCRTTVRHSTDIDTQITILKLSLLIGIMATAGFRMRSVWKHNTKTSADKNRLLALENRFSEIACFIENIMIRKYFLLSFKKKES